MVARQHLYIDNPWTSTHTLQPTPFPYLTGDWVNIKMPSCQYRKSHCVDKMILLPSYSTMEFLVLVKQHLYIESGPCFWHTSLRDTVYFSYYWPLPRYAKSRIEHAPGMPERFSRHRFQKKPLVCDPGMYHGTCVTHVPWCMSGTLNRDGREKRSRHSRRMRNSQFYVSQW